MEYKVRYMSVLFTPVDDIAALEVEMHLYGGR